MNKAKNLLKNMNQNQKQEEEKNNKTGYASWKRFRNRVNIGLLIFALITLYFSFYFVGPIRGKVVDAKTDKPIEGIGIGYLISGDDLFCLNPGGCGGWGKGIEAYTDDNGKFKIPLSIALKFPFLQWLTNRHISASDKYDLAGNKNYDSYEEDFIWFPFRSFKFSLVPIPKTLDDCRDNLTADEQYRCVKQLAGRDSSKFKLSEYYLMNKYLNILNNKCDLELYVDDPSCIALKAFNQKDKNICANDKSCLFDVAIDLQDNSWCEALPSPKESIYSKEDCEKVIDALTAEGK